MSYLKFLRGSLDISSCIDSIRYKRDFKRSHPEYFDPDGIIVFCGPQGSGKTLSAVQYVIKLAKKYPGVIIVSNVELRGLPDSVRVFRWEGSKSLSEYNNGYAGVIFLVDEIQIDFMNLESRDIDPAVLTEICQQRKQRKHIVGTSQVFQRIAKPFREQFKYAVLCRCLGGLFQFNTLIDGAKSVEDSNGHIRCDTVRRFFWWHSPALYNSYDTYAKVIRMNPRKDKVRNGY